MADRTGAPHATGRPPARRPNATPMRALIGAGGLAAVSAIGGAIVAQPQPYTGPEIVAEPTPIAPGTPVVAQRPVRYVQLEPGQTVPPGARVIQAGAPTPITVVTVVPAPPKRNVVVTTTQSGAGK